ncbi:phosphoglycerol transferase family protein, alkaline phosphatase superfamily [Desulfosporosinus youngiae DSM 17734]|uniref:Phosphoglycerol transferase family protein, alkaline phosphatase superfamily n=2 Tax=Desulfosporosinus TaxID=79206 RepID=H5XUP9_9FIRM|nr:phosphoglycerol transferase family protein, alkaline phosphatase superfamily [Desulfosporosinus youngiae DSM 17734]
MARLEDEFANVDRKLSNFASIRRNLYRGLHVILSGLGIKDSLFVFTVAAMLVKSILFIGLINNDNATQYNHMKAFYSFSSSPPLAVYVSFIVIILSFAFLFKGRFRFWFLLSCNSLFSTLLIVDLMYYRGYSSFVTPYLLSQTTNLDNLFSSIISMLRQVDLLFVLDLILLLGIGLKFKKFYIKTQRSIYTLLILFVLSVVHVYYQHVQIDLKGNGDEMLFRVAWSPNQTMSNLSPLGYHGFDIYNYVKDSKDAKLTPEENEEIKNWLAQNQEKLPANEYKGIFKGKNLIMIQVESLETSVINQKVNGQEITPNLNKLLANSFYFSNFYEQVYNGSSSDADLMANTSVYPVRTGATFFRFPNNTYNSLPKLLKEDGYSTLAIHPDKGSYWNWVPALTAIGFEKTMDDSCFNTDEKIGLGLCDGSYFKQIAPLIREQEQPFYDFMVTLTSHNPFDLPERYRSLMLSEDFNKTKLGGYFQSIRYTDEQIGSFLDTLDKSGVLDNTVVVIYGDHTGVHKYYNDEVKAIQPQESWWLDDSKRIPLIIYHKGMNGREIPTIGGQIDTMPTILYLMGINEERYANTVFGRNLLNTKKDFAVLANRVYMGEAENSTEYENHIKGIDMADLVIRKNYFKEAGYK